MVKKSARRTRRTHSPVLAKARLSDRQQIGSRWEVVADLRRTVGQEAAAPGFVGTSFVTVVYEAIDCSNKFRAGNEVVTMHPGRPR
jgi:hypothetical protein